MGQGAQIAEVQALRAKALEQVRLAKRGEGESMWGGGGWGGGREGGPDLVMLLILAVAGLGSLYLFD